MVEVGATAFDGHQKIPGSGRESIDGEWCMLVQSTATVAGRRSTVARTMSGKGGSVQVREAPDKGSPR